ncbi:hypothetical protein BH23GEM6_BH23GEM6_08160 [soil metagenome]
MARFDSAAAADGKKIADEEHAGSTVKPRLQDGRRPYVAPRDPRLGRGTEASVATAGPVQDRGENAGAVEMRQTAPFDRAVHPDQGARMPIPDQAQTLDRRVAGCRVHPAGRRKN